MNEKFEKNPEVKGPEKLEDPRDSAITEKGDQELSRNIDQNKTDSADTPSMGYEAETGLKAKQLMMVDSADSESMAEMEAIKDKDPKIQQELAMRRSIRENMEVGPGRDEAEKIAKEVFRAKEVIEPTEYEVVKGDNLWRISRMHLGKSASDQEVKEHVDQIVNLNGIKNPDLIYPGEVYKLPGFTVLGEIRTISSNIAQNDSANIPVPVQDSQSDSISSISVLEDNHEVSVKNDSSIDQNYGDPVENKDKDRDRDGSEDKDRSKDKDENEQKDDDNDRAFKPEKTPERDRPREKPTIPEQGDDFRKPFGST